MKVRRFGFALLPDFAGAAHSYTGARLDAATGDAGPFDETSTRDKALRSYITVSGGGGRQFEHRAALRSDDVQPGPAAGATPSHGVLALQRQGEEL